jgi:DNA-binding PadR family transcriptional regulator
MGEECSNLLPLSPPHLYILLALASSEKHGYAIMQEVKELSEGTYKLGPATLYENIAKLLTSGAIVEVTSQTLADQRRRNYRLTATGQRALQLEMARLGRLIARSEASRGRQPEVSS